MIPQPPLCKSGALPVALHPYDTDDGCCPRYLHCDRVASLLFLFIGTIRHLGFEPKSFTIKGRVCYRYTNGGKSG